MKIWLNDGLVSDVTLPAIGGGWLLGDGVFESMRTYGGIPFALQRHLERLRQNADVMQFAQPNWEMITLGVNEVIHANPCQPYGRLRITLLGDGNTVITHTPFIDDGKALKLTTADSKQLSTRVTASLKTISYAENSLALRKARLHGFDDAIFVNEKGNVVETALANVVWFDDGSWWTPSAEDGCLPGITRALLIENFGVREGSVTPTSLLQVNAVAITSSVREVIAIARYESKLFGASKQLEDLRGSFHAWVLGNLGA